MNEAAFPHRLALLIACVIGAIYCLPQALYYYEFRTPQVLLEENLDESTYAVWVSRAAGEHAGQPDPYLLGAPAIGFAALQPLPELVLGTLARWLHIRANTLLWLGSFAFTALSGWLFVALAWACGVRERLWLAVFAGFALLALPPLLWPMQARYTTAMLANVDPGFRLTLPHSRRFQPQFTVLFHYAALVSAMLILRARTATSRKGWALVAGAALGATVYCYYFSWSLLLAWFVCAGAGVWWWRRECFGAWALALSTGLILAVPYFVKLAAHFATVSASSAAARTHAWPRDPALWLALGMVVLLGAGLLLRERHSRWLLWVSLTLNLAVAIGAMQNVVTGIYVQPYHYLHYFGRPVVNLGCVALAYVISQRMVRRYGGLARWVNPLLCLSLLAIGLSSLALQCARYLEARPAAQRVLAAQAAFAQIRQLVAPGATVHTFAAEVREALPLYTDAVPFTALAQLLTETAVTRAALQERLVIAAKLAGMSEAQFAAWLQGRPHEVFLQDLQHAQEPATQARMQRTAQELQQRFATMSEAELRQRGPQYVLFEAGKPSEPDWLRRGCQPVPNWSVTNYNLCRLR